MFLCFLQILGRTNDLWWVHMMSSRTIGKNVMILCVFSLSGSDKWSHFGDFSLEITCLSNPSAGFGVQRVNWLLAMPLIFQSLCHTFVVFVFSSLSPILSTCPLSSFLPSLLVFLHFFLTLLLFLFWFFFFLLSHFFFSPLVLLLVLCCFHFFLSLFFAFSVVCCLLALTLLL